MVKVAPELLNDINPYNGGTKRLVDAAIVSPHSLRLWLYTGLRFVNMEIRHNYVSKFLAKVRQRAVSQRKLPCRMPNKQKHAASSCPTGQR